MGDFVKLNTALPPLKSDAHPPVNPTQEVDAADLNNLWAAAGDLRDHGSGWINVKDYGAKADGVTDDTTAIQGAITAAAGKLVVIPPGTVGTYSNPTRTPVIDLRPISTNSFGKFDTIGMPVLYMRRSYRSAPVSGAGIINTYWDPIWRFDMETTPGDVSGSAGGLFFYMRDASGKTGTTITQDILATGAQTVSVADSTVFAVNDTPYVDIGTGQGESITITAIPDTTHITANFTKTHTTGAWVADGNKGSKVGITSLITEGATNSNNLTVFHANLVSTAGGIHSANGMEANITCNVPTSDWYGDGKPQVTGFTLTSYGTQDASFGGFIGSGTGGVTNFKTALRLNARNQAIWIVNNLNSSVPPDVGIRVGSAGSYGIIIGKNQTVPHPREINVNPSIAGILLAAKDTVGTVGSNTIRFEGLNAGVSEVWDVYRASLAAGAIRFDYQGVWTGIALDSDGGISSQLKLRIRKTDNTEIGSLALSGTSSILTADILRTNGTVAASGSIRLAAGGTVAFRNAGNTADVVALSKDGSDRAVVGGTAGAIATSLNTARLVTPISADRGDASVTLTVGTDVMVQRFATALTANRTVTLSTTGAVNGDYFRVVRTGLGAFTLDVGGLKTIPSATAAFVDVMYTGSAWALTGYGAL